MYQAFIQKSAKKVAKIPPYYSHFAGCSRVFTYVHILSEGCFPNFSSCCKCRVHTVKLDKNQGLFQNFPGQNYYFSRTVLLLLRVILKQYRLIGKAANTILLYNFKYKKKFSPEIFTDLCKRLYDFPKKGNSKTFKQPNQKYCFPRISRP